MIDDLAPTIPRTTADYRRRVEHAVHLLYGEGEADLTDAEWEHAAELSEDAFGKAYWPIDRDGDSWILRSVQAAKKLSPEELSAEALYTGIERLHDVYWNGEESVICLYESSDRDGIVVIERGKQDHEGSWMPPAGRIDDGEDTYDAAQREMREEAGIDTGFERIGELRDTTYNARLHLMRARGDEQPVAGSDADSARWVSYSDLKPQSMTDTMYAAVIAGKHLDTIPHKDLMDYPLNSRLNMASRRVMRGRYGVGDQTDTTDTVARLRTDTVTVHIGPLGGERPSVWMEAYDTIPYANEIELRRIGKELTGTTEWRSLPEHSDYSENDRLWAKLRALSS